MHTVLRTSRAEEDLLDIWEHIADDSLDAADGFLDEIAEVCHRLAENPLAGRAREELAVNLRSFPVGNYVVFYQPIENGINVIRVLHGARDLPELL